MATETGGADHRCEQNKVLTLQMLRGPLIGCVLLSSFVALFGQPSIAESLFQTPGADRADLNNADPNNAVNRHTRANGKPCIDVKSYTNPEIVNKNLFEHWIAATNSCGQHIALQVCYHQSSSCILMKVPPWESKNSVLGISPMNSFQFDAKEKF
jgi:hypothetical protein